MEDGESSEGARGGGRSELWEGGTARTFEDEAYESLTLQLGRHFRLNSISRVRGLAANPDCLDVQ